MPGRDQTEQEDLDDARAESEIVGFLSRNASQDLPASFIAFVLGAGEDPTVDDRG